MASDVRPPKRLRVMEDAFENYDVFISHRGPDTKTRFVGFLHEGLKAAGLRPFLDCESIDKGQDAWECIDHAIKTTPIALVIFSKSFAQSEWCLKELHLMLGTPCVKVLPIFYNVQPWEVRFPERGQLAAGFEKLKQRHDKTIIEQWRADMGRASKLNGWEQKLADQRLEKDLVKEVVGKIFELANKSLPLHVGDHVVGVNQVAEGIIQTLDDRKTVLMLGLWGMGGIGKSTLARELYNQLGKRFAGSCYVEDVTDKVNQGGVVKVQNCILKDLCKDMSVQIEDKSKGKVILEERLCKKNILLVLDDVCDDHDLDYWISRKMLTEGSMCIVTSRNRRVFEKSNSFDVNHKIYVHDVQVLNKEDSRQVFTAYAFGGDSQVKEGFEDLITDISLACGGVPLVLKVCGALLREEENVEIWEEVVKKLNSGTIMDEKKIFECLRISFDALEQQQQEMFLDIACAVLGQSQDMAMRVWKSLNWSPALGVRSLKEKALIKVDDNGCFAMHDHLRDMGREIARKRRVSEGTCRRLWMPESLTMLKEDESLPDSLQTLVISKDLYFPVVSLDLSHMKELRILICDDTIKLTSVHANLRWLNWQEYEKDEETDARYGGDRYGDGEEEYHDEDGLLLCNIENIFSITPQNNKLVVLNIGCTRHSFESVNQKIYFKDLQVLHYRNYYFEMSLGEEILQSKNLEVLDLSCCSKLSTLPEKLGSLRNLSSLCLNYCDLKELPYSLDQLTRLAKLSLMGYQRYFEYDHSMSTISEIRYLRELNLHDSGISSLPESFGRLSNLEMLNLSSCEQLHKLPDSSGSLRNLRDLNLAHSGILTLPESFGGLNNLETLNLRNCPKLSLLPDSFGSLENLRELNLELSGIKSLPESFGELSNLEVLNLSRCLQLIMLPESFGNLHNLKYLNLRDSTVIVSLPASFGELLSSLEGLNRYDFEKPIMLLDLFGSLRSLSQVTLCGSGIEKLLESFEELSNLQGLDISYCRSLRALPRAFAQLANVKKLDL